jgi:hypothetical protein
LVDRNTDVQLATLQYQAGRRGLLWVERLQTEQVSVEDCVMRLRSARIANRIRRHPALGGSFDASSPVAELAGDE